MVSRDTQEGKDNMATELSGYEIRLLRSMAGEGNMGLCWGAAMSEAVEHLSSIGYVKATVGENGGVIYQLTPKARNYLRLAFVVQDGDLVGKTASELFDIELSTVGELDALREALHKAIRITNEVMVALNDAIASKVEKDSEIIQLRKVIEGFTERALNPMVVLTAVGPRSVCLDTVVGMANEISQLHKEAKELAEMYVAGD